jgi:large subunit ribosomal protein L17
VEHEEKMRHGKTVNHLGRKSEHRKALLANLACSLIEHKRINTTVAKAKALRKYVEPLITKSKTDSTHSRRMVFSYLKSKEAVTELFREVAPKIAERPGGYVRIIRTGLRHGDNAELCMIELVDFNTLYGKEAAKAAAKKRTRRGGATKKKEEGAAEVSAEAGAEAPAAEAKPKAKRTTKKKTDEGTAE